MRINVKLVVNATLDTLLENVLFRDAFCAGCEAGHVAYDEECPAGWMPCEKECVRWSNWSDLERGISECVSRSMKA